MNAGALKGIRVVDLSSVVVGPVATQFLADYGADVIKVEAPGGDLLRTLGGRSDSGQFAPKFMHFNRNKRSIAIDLKSAEGREAVLALLRTADVCVANMRPSALKRLGLDAQALLEVNPRLVYCGLVGFGQQGRYRSRPAYDGIIQGVSGVAGTFERADGEPRYVPMTVADHIVGIIASQMIMLALFERQQTGRGQSIEVPMFENMAAFVLSEHMGQHTFAPPRGPMGDARLLDPGARPIPTRDGFISISANTDAQAFALFDAIGRPELKLDPRFSSVKARYDNVGQYFQVRAEGLATRTTAEWLEVFDRLDVPAAPCHTLETLMQDPHLQDVGLLATERHPREGDVVSIQLPNRSTVRAREEWGPPPACGQHTREVLGELGYAADRVDAMFASGAAFAAGETA